MRLLHSKFIIIDIDFMKLAKISKLRLNIHVAFKKRYVYYVYLYTNRVMCGYYDLANVIGEV